MNLSFFFKDRENPKRGYSLTWSWKTMFDYLIKNWTSQSNDLWVSWNYRRHLYYQWLNLNAFISRYFTHLCYWLTLASKTQSQRLIFSGKHNYLCFGTMQTERVIKALKSLFLFETSSHMSLISLSHSWLGAPRIWPSLWPWS